MSKRDERMYRVRGDDEAVAARLAIKFHCAYCMGFQPSEVPLCTAPECWLFPWRLGKTPAILKKTRPASSANLDKARERLSVVRKRTKNASC